MTTSAPPSDFPAAEAASKQGYTRQVTAEVTDIDLITTAIPAEDWETHPEGHNWES